MKKTIIILIILIRSFWSLAAQHVPVISQREDIARQGVLDGFDFGPFKMPDMTAIVDSIIRKPKMTKPFHFSDAEMNALAPKNIADAIEIIRPPRSNAHGSANLKYKIQTPPERTHMSPSFDIRYISEMREEGMLGIGWTISKFVLCKKTIDGKTSFVWNGKVYSEGENPGAGHGRVVSASSKTTVIEEDSIKYSFSSTTDKSLFLLDNSSYKGDTIKYYYVKGSDVRRNCAKIDSIDCIYKEDLIPHVKIKFSYTNDFISKILVQTSKEKYEFTKKDARVAKEDRYETFCTYSFSKKKSANDESKYLLNGFNQTFESDKNTFSHTFEYYNDTTTISQLEELEKIYLDSAYTENVDSVKSLIDSYKTDRTDLLKVVHTPLGACYTVNYGREIIKDKKDEKKQDTMLVMKYLKINDGYHEDGPYVLNRYSYAGGSTFRIDSIKNDPYKSEDENKITAVRFDTVFTHNMSVDDKVLQTMRREYYQTSGNIYESESYRAKKESVYKDDASNPDHIKEFAYSIGTTEITLDGKLMTRVKKEKEFSYSVGTLSYIVSFSDNHQKVSFLVKDNSKTVFKEEIVYNGDKKATFKRYKNNTDFIPYELTYDEYGNMVKCEMPSNSAESQETLTYLYEYDRRFNQYQTGVVDSRGFTSHMEDYDYTIGLPKTIRDINGYVKKIGYKLKSGLDTVVSPIRIDLEDAKKKDKNGNEEKIYSSLSTYNGVNLNKDSETKGRDRLDTLSLKVDIAIKDSVKNALLSDSVKSRLFKSVFGDNSGLTIADIDFGCKLTFEKESLEFADTLAFAECFCTDTIKTPSSIQLFRYDEVKRSNIQSSLYVDGMGREVYDNKRNGAALYTKYGAHQYDEVALKTFMHTPSDDRHSSTQIKYTSPTYDEFGRIVELHSLNSFGEEVKQKFVYDAVGRVTRYSDDKTDLSYTYDMLGNILSVTDAKSKKTTSYTYDNAGNIITKTTPSGDVITYVYELDNLKEVRYPRIPSANVTNIYGNKNSSYGRRNRVALSYNSSVVDEYFYNQQGNVSKVRRTMVVPNGKIQTYVTEFKYDTWGRLTEMIYPDGEILTYSFNAAGLPSKVEGSKTFKYQYIDTVGYDYLDRLTSIVFHNGIERSVTYDNNTPKYETKGVGEGSAFISALESSIGEVDKGADENFGMAAVSNDGFLSAYFYDMSGNLSMNIGASNEKVHVNGLLSGVSSTIESKHLIVNPYFEDQDSLCVKHILLNGERLLTKEVDSFSYGARPVRIERAGSNVEEIGLVVNYDSLHSLTANKAVQERVATIDEDFSVDHVPFYYSELRSANVDNGEDNKETNLYVYRVDANGTFVQLLDKDRIPVFTIGSKGNVSKSDDLRFIPLIRSNELMKDIDNNADIPMFELNNELHLVRDAFGR